MNWAPTTTRTIDLGYEQLLTFEGRPGTRVRVLYGSMWLTEEGDERDVFARTGDEVTLTSDGLSVIEGIGAARVQVIEQRRPTLTTALVHRLAHVWETLRARRLGRRPGAPLAGRPISDVLARSVLLALAVVVSIAVLHIAAPGPIVWHAAAASAQVQAPPENTLGAVLDDLASARTGFLAVN